MIFLSKYVVSTNNGYLFYCFGSNFLWLYGQGSSGSTVSQTGSFPTDNNWHNIVGTADNTGTQIFIDGIKAAGALWSGTPGTPTQSAPFAIGSPDHVNKTPVGMMDDIRIYKRVLTDSEIQKLSNDK